MNREEERADMLRAITVLNFEIESLRAKLVASEAEHKRFFDAGWHHGRRTNLNAAGSWRVYLQSIGRA